jgi:hypothetical protein
VIGKKDGVTGREFAGRKPAALPEPKSMEDQVVRFLKLYLLIALACIVSLAHSGSIAPIQAYVAITW